MVITNFAAKSTHTKNRTVLDLYMHATDVLRRLEAYIIDEVSLKEIQEVMRWASFQLRMVAGGFQLWIFMRVFNMPVQLCPGSICWQRLDRRT